MDDEPASLALIHALEDLLEEGEDYAELTVARICAQAGVARSTFYLNFADRADLLVAMTGDLRHYFVDVARAWWESPAAMEREELAEAIGVLVGTYRAYEEQLGAVMDVAPYEPVVAAAFASVVDAIRIGLEVHVRSGQEAGVFDARLDPAATAAWLVAMFQRGLQRLVGGSGEEEGDALTETLIELVWRALYAPQAAAHG